MTTQVWEHAHPVARPLAAPVVSATVGRNRRGFGRFGRIGEPTLRGHAPDLSAPTSVVGRS